jgi:hypothetical protein
MPSKQEKRTKNVLECDFEIQLKNGTESTN